MAFGLQDVAMGLLLLSFVATGVAFFAPFWLISLTDGHTEGLWGYCPIDMDCIWFHENDFAREKILPGESSHNALLGNFT
jgi:hypothetical protein